MVIKPSVPGRMIFEARSRAELTRRQLAERAGIEASLLAAYEIGAEEPTVKVLARIFRAIADDS